MTQERPNIIFIITDQQRFDTISALGYDFMDTPNLDRLVRKEFLYRLSRNSCLLLPARASLFRDTLHNWDIEERRSLAA